MLSLDMPCYGGTTPWHNADEAYIFHHAEFFESEYIPGISEKLQDEMAGALVSFAYTGNPNHKGLPKWNVAEKDVIPTMIFDKETEEKINRTGGKSRSFRTRR